MRKVLLVIPRTFCVRAFLMTAFLKTLSRDVEVAIVSPYGEDPQFVTRFGLPHVSFYCLPDFSGFRGEHARWHRWHRDLLLSRWKLLATKITDETTRYMGGTNGVIRPFDVKAKVRRLAIESVKHNSLVLTLITKREITTYWSTYDTREYDNLFDQIRPDLVVSTKSAIWDEYPIARTAEKRGTPQITYVLSFDNLVTNGIFPVAYDKWLVWNDINKGEVLYQYSGVEEQDVEVCGPLQFDFYANRDYIIPRSEWVRKLDLDPDRPIILLGAGPLLIAPQEPHIAVQILQAIRACRVVQNPQLLIRLHPDDRLERWKDVISDYPEVRFSIPWKIIEEHKNLAIPTNEDICLLASTLAHSSVVINTSSSLALDAAYFDRPVICLAYDDRPGQPFDSIVRRLYEREHYVPIVLSGGVKLVYDKEALFQAINDYLSEPGRDREERLEMLNRFDPFHDGKAWQRTASAILEFLSRN